MSISQKFRPQTAEKHLKNDIVLNIISKKKTDSCGSMRRKTKSSSKSNFTRQRKNRIFSYFKECFFFNRLLGYLDLSIFNLISGTSYRKLSATFSIAKTDFQKTNNKKTELAKKGKN